MVSTPKTASSEVIVHVQRLHSCPAAPSSAAKVLARHRITLHSSIKRQCRVSALVVPLLLVSEHVCEEGKDANEHAGSHDGRAQVGLANCTHMHSQQTTLLGSCSN